MNVLKDRSFTWSDTYFHRHLWVTYHLFVDLKVCVYLYVRVFQVVFEKRHLQGVSFGYDLK